MRASLLLLASAALLAARATPWLPVPGSLAAPFGAGGDALRRAGLAAFVIDLAALASLWRSRTHSRKAKVAWTAIVALLPVLGAVAWFTLGRQRHPPPRTGS